MDSNTLLINNLPSNKKLDVSIDAAHIDNAVLKRLISEIKLDDHLIVNGYNRTHNRHNRGR